MIEHSVDNPSHQPSVVGPNTVPTGSRYDASTENYAVGYPDIPSPDWLTEVSDRTAEQRALEKLADEQRSIIDNL